MMDEAPNTLLLPLIMTVACIGCSTQAMNSLFGFHSVDIWVARAYTSLKDTPPIPQTATNSRASSLDPSKDAYRTLAGYLAGLSLQLVEFRFDSESS
jgi:hypothetical protein